MFFVLGLLAQCFEELSIILIKFNIDFLLIKGSCLGLVIEKLFCGLFF